MSRKAILKLITALALVVLVLQPLFLPALPVQAQEVGNLLVVSSEAQASNAQVEEELELDDVIVAAAADTEIPTVIPGPDVPTMTAVETGDAAKNQCHTVYAPLKEINALESEGKMAFDWKMTLETSGGRWTVGYGLAKEDFHIDITPRNLWSAACGIREPEYFFWHHTSMPKADAINFFVPKGWKVLIFGLHHQQVKVDGITYDRPITGTMEIAGQTVILLDHADTPYGLTVTGLSEPAPEDGMFTLETYDSLPVWIMLVPPDESETQCTALTLTEDRSVVGQVTATASVQGENVQGNQAQINFWGNVMDVTPGQKVSATANVSGTYPITGSVLSNNGFISSDACKGSVTLVVVPEEPETICSTLTITEDRSVENQVTVKASVTGENVVNDNAQINFWGNVIAVSPGEEVSTTVDVSGTYPITGSVLSDNGFISSDACKGSVTLVVVPEEPETICSTLTITEDRSVEGQVTVKASVVGENVQGNQAQINFWGNVMDVTPGQEVLQTVNISGTYPITGSVLSDNGFISSDACKGSVTLVIVPEEPKETVCSNTNFELLPGEMPSFFNGAWTIVIVSIDNPQPGTMVGMVDGDGNIVVASQTGLREFNIFQDPRKTYTVTVNGIPSTNPACSNKITGVFLNLIEHVTEQAACLTYTASIPAGAPIWPGQTVDIAFNVDGATAATLGSMVETPIHGWVYFNGVVPVAGEPLTPTLTRADGTVLPAGEQCTVSYRSMPTEKPILVLTFWSDPEWEVANGSQIFYDWEAGEFRSEIENTAMGSYTIQLDGGEEGYAAGWTTNTEKAIFGFRQLAYPVHHELSWVDNNGTGVGFLNLASEHGQEHNQNPIEAVINVSGETNNVPWDAGLIGTDYYLPDLRVTFGTFTNFRNNHVPAIAVTNGCVSIVAARESLDSRDVPNSPVIQVAVYPGCEEYLSQLTGGYLLDLLRGGQTMGDPNAFLEAGLGIGQAVASAAQEQLTKINFTKVD